VLSTTARRATRPGGRAIRRSTVGGRCDRGGEGGAAGRCPGPRCGLGGVRLAWAGERARCRRRQARDRPSIRRRRARGAVRGGARDTAPAGLGPPPPARLQRVVAGALARAPPLRRPLPTARPAWWRAGL